MAASCICELAGMPRVIVCVGAYRTQVGLKVANAAQTEHAEVKVVNELVVGAAPAGSLAPTPTSPQLPDFGVVWQGVSSVVSTATLLLTCV